MLVDPFCLYVIALDELWTQAEGVMKDIGNVFGTMERVSQFCPMPVQLVMEPKQMTIANGFSTPWTSLAVQPSTAINTTL